MQFNKIYLGSTEIKKAMLSSTVVLDNTGGGVSNLYVSADAANPDKDSEVNGIGSWYDEGGNGEEFISVAEASNGLYSLRITSNAASWGRYGIDITGLDNTKTYRFEYDLKSNNAADNAVGSGFTHFKDATDAGGDSCTLHDTWESFSQDKSPTGTSITILLYGTAGVESGEQIHIDNIRITQL